MILDAYKNALPVIASKVGGVREIVIDGETGIFVTPNDGIELLNKMTFLADRKNIEPMLEKCYEKLLQFTEKSFINAYEDIYKDIVGTKKTFKS